jgi:hypothetical protein
MGKCLLIFSLYCIMMYASPQDTCVIFTEIMFNAPSGNNEFIEVYNRSEKVSISLSHFKIKYSTSKADTIISAGYGTLLPPKAYAVIFEGDYDFASGIYKNVVPSSALILKISDNSFGSNGMANTANRPLWLINSVDDTLDYYTYSADNTGSYSDEKLNMSSDTSSANWKNSIKLFGTPGFKNSVTSVVVPDNNPGDVIINEIMYAPLTGEPEWIELYNRTGSSISLKDWTITDVLTTPATVIITTDVSIPSKSYLILAKDSTIFNSHPVITSPVLKLNIPPLNNDGDGVTLKDNTGLMIDSLKYDPLWGGSNGCSLERKSAEITALSKDNWGNSKDIERSTPGRINSLTPKPYDLSIGDILFNPKFPVAGDNVSVSAIIKNNGTLSADNFTVLFYYKEELKDWKDLSASVGLSLSAGDSLTVPAADQISQIKNNYTVAVKVVFVQDQDTLNNYFEKNVGPGAGERTIIVNEIMYDPETGEPEWIELKNVSSEIINLKSWSISDLLTTPTKSIISSEDYFLNPGELMIAARDSIFCLIHPELSSQTRIVKYGILGNTEDGIFVFDYRNGIIDSVIYNSSWGHKKGYSIERISQDKPSNDSSNWTLSLCSNKSTPAKENSVVSIPDGKKNDLVVNEIMYDPAAGNNEFVEFYNLSGGSVNIGGWSIEDQHKNIYKLSDTNFVIPQGSYFILASDSSVIRNYNLFSFADKTILNESSLGLTADELILLKDLRGNVIDSVYYSDKWHNKNYTTTKGRSLERINPYLGSNDKFNWNTCVDQKGATPGTKNSIYVINSKINSSISVSPNPFSPDNDGFEDCCIINYTLMIPISQVNIKIYDSRGRLVRILSNNMASGSTGSVIFNGRGDDGLALRMGIYIIFLEALNSSTGQNQILKTTVVIARKLH